MRNRLTLVVAGAALAIASGTAVAGSNVSFGISFGVPAPVYVAPPAVVYAPPPPVYYAPARVYYAPAYYAPAYYAPAPVVIKYRHGHRHGHRNHW
jgi:hypothetical protein